MNKIAYIAVKAKGTKQKYYVNELLQPERRLPIYLHKKLLEIKHCQKCKNKESKYDKNTTLTTHHIKPLSEGGQNEEKNLLRLCKKCHKEIHENKKIEEEKKYE